MCTSPIYISRSNIGAAHSRILRGQSAIGSSLVSQSMKGICVPCGKCDECLKSRQNEVMIRALREAEHARSAHFFTFTYREEDLPISASLWHVNESTGELTCDIEPEIVERTIGRGKKRHYNDTYISYRDGLLATEFRPRRITIPCFLDESGKSAIPGMQYFVVAAPSVNNRDVRLVIKNARITCQRSETISDIAPDFKYLLCSEYGHKNTMRPHYHMFAFNLTDEQADVIAGLWKYGDVQVKTVHKFNPDGTPAYTAVARYIAKYTAKGKYDPAHLMSGYVCRHRLCASKSFGLSDFAARDYLLARDLVDYDPDDINSCEKLTQDQKKIIGEAMQRRLVFPVNYVIKSKEPEDYGQIKSFTAEYRFPPSLLDKLFKKSYSEGSLKCSPIYYIYSDFLRAKHSDDDNKEFVQFVTNSGTEDLSLACAAYDNYKKALLQARAEVCRQSHINFYKKTKL